MTRLRHVFRLEVVVESPFIFPGAETQAVGVDAPAMRDADGRALLPADHLKGLLLEAVTALEQAAPAVLGGLTRRDLFGRVKANETDPLDGEPDGWAPARGRLLFADLVAAEDSDWCKRTKSQRAHTRVQIDDERGAVADGMLQVVELCAPFATEVWFEGELLFHGEAAEGARAEALLAKALKLVPFFGGHRSIGFGRHCTEKSKIMLSGAAPVIAPAARKTPRRRMHFDATFDRPFLVATRAIGGNIFIGETIAPGGAIKGALADMLERAGLDPRGEGVLSGVLARLRISHAFPVDNGVLLDRAIPLAIKAIKDSKAAGQLVFGDASLDGSGLIDGRCADFQPDWKDEISEQFRRIVNRPAAEVPHRPRIHTAINRQTGAALEENLFVEVAGGPGAGDGKQQLTLRFSVEFAEGEEKTEAATDIAAILAQRLDAIGKTRAIMTLKPAGEPPARPPPKGAGPWTVLLETPAALLDLDSPHAPKADGRPAPANVQLDAYIKTAIPGSRLDDCFLGLRRAGGFHARLSQGPYQPTTLFAAGSTLRIACDDPASAGAVAGRLAKLERTGLPVMRWNDRGGLDEITDWRACAYLPQNGYGEISVDDQAFASIRAKGRP
jgi:hypothetical protein